MPMFAATCISWLGHDHVVAAIGPGMVVVVVVGGDGCERGKGGGMLRLVPLELLAVVLVVVAMVVAVVLPHQTMRASEPE